MSRFAGSMAEEASYSTRAGLAKDERCFDQDSPFAVTHIGKLVTHNNIHPPRNHCVVQSSQAELSLVRFTPLCRVEMADVSAQSITGRPARLGIPKELLANADQAAETHQKHLAFLAKIGLNPLVSIISRGECSAFDNASGVFTQQPLLPPAARTLTDTPDDRKYRVEIGQAVKQYLVWADEQPVRLRDIYTMPQYSLLPDGQIVLQDVEPLYKCTPYYGSW